MNNLCNDTLAPQGRSNSYFSILLTTCYNNISVIHVTVKSDASESITWLHFKLCNAHFSKTNSCFR